MKENRFEVHHFSEPRGSDVRDELFRIANEVAGEQVVWNDSKKLVYGDGTDLKPELKRSISEAFLAKYFQPMPASPELRRKDKLTKPVATQEQISLEELSIMLDDALQVA